MHSPKFVLSTFCSPRAAATLTMSACVFDTTSALGLTNRVGAAIGPPRTCHTNYPCGLFCSPLSSRAGVMMSLERKALRLGSSDVRSAFLDPRRCFAPRLLLCLHRVATRIGSGFYTPPQSRRHVSPVSWFSTVFFIAGPHSPVIRNPAAVELASCCCCTYVFEEKRRLHV